MTGWTKSARALFAALVTTQLALLMHIGAGGSASPIGTAVVFVLVLWAAMILASRRLGYLSLSALLGLGQVLMHLTMSWSSGAQMGAHTASASGGSGHGSMASGSHSGHLVPASGSLDLSSATAAVGHSTHGDTSSGMILAHLVAVALTAVVLKRGEDIVLSILQLALGPVIGAMHALAEAAGVLADRPARLLASRCPLPQAIASAVVGANYRRGPPALV
ncbi:hypothetical protein [Brevibacterium renqingii]|uniref:hypothetical protein n=1 Tax=Brevibacterium renqingii TaxID=2776916 RepID=UPI001AE07D90|nr:hypothetical protein [Brevibacterium renqingii]